MNDFRKASSPLLGIVRKIEEQRARAPQPPPRDPRPCERCGDQGFFLGRAGDSAVAIPCGCERTCGTCGGRGFLLQVRDGYEFSQTCECQTLASRIAAYNAAHLPARFSGKGFDDFRTNPDDPPDLLRAKREMLHFADTARPGHTTFGKGLVGGPGRGKTHLLAATLARLTLGRGIQARYIEIGFLFADLKAAISDPRVRAAVDKVDDLAAVDVLAIDELGKGRGSQFEEEILDELIGRRYNTGKLTLFATNFPRTASTAPARGERPELAQQSLRVRVGERVYSRLHEMVEFVEIPPTARDRRGAPGG